MPDLGLKTFDKLYPMMIRKYQDLIVDQNASEADKINSIILKLNALGKLSNDVVRDWNTVYNWAMNDGLNTDVSNKIELMKSNGELATILQGIFNALTGDMTTLHTVAKDTLVNSINEVDDLAKANQTSLAQSVSQEKVETSDSFDYRGVNFFGSNNTAGFAAGTRLNQILDSIQASNMNMVVINACNYMTTKTDTTFQGQVQPDSDITNLCNLAKARGLKIAFKPLVQIADGTPRSNLAPSDISAWFTNFKTWILHQAQLAQTAGADIFCVGTEMASLSSLTYRSYWVDLISSVRGVFSGLITYAANGTGALPIDEVYSFCFVDLLDFAGIDFYPALTNKNNPTVDEMVSAWFNNANGINYMDAIEKWQLSHGKPVIFTETGCASLDGANTSTNGIWASGTSDEQEQADYITAMFNVLRKRCSWVKGIWWWDISINFSYYNFDNTPSTTAFNKGFTSLYKGAN